MTRAIAELTVPELVYYLMSVWDTYFYAKLQTSRRIACGWQFPEDFLSLASPLHKRLHLVLVTSFSATSGISLIFCSSFVFGRNYNL